jgi:sarcosine oxidase, subunit gamma
MAEGAVILQRMPPELAVIPPVRVASSATRYILRGGAPVQAAAGQALGLRVPQEPCRAERSGERAALWLGPDEWLLLAPADAGTALGSAIAAALEGLPHSLVDVSHRQIGLEIEGAAGVTLLAAGCPLDLHPDTFPVGMCTRTVLGKSEITLWRVAPEAFRLEVWRSFAAYVCAFLVESARGI